jgi:hypothetical protein
MGLSGPKLMPSAMELEPALAEEDEAMVSDESEAPEPPLTSI